MTKQLRRPAPPSRALSDLKGKTLKDITSDDYDSLVSTAFLEESNLDLLKDIALVSNSKQSPSGSMAGTSKIVVKAFSDTGDVTVYQPDEGQVWILQEISLSIVNTSGSPAIVSIGLEAGGNSMQASSTISTSSSQNYNSQALTFPNTTFSIDENTKITISKTGSFTEIGIFLHLVRVR